MKKLYSIFLILFVTMAFSQAPMVTSISGSSVLCSGNSTSSYTGFATNSPTSYSWIVLPSTGVIISNPIGSLTTISFPSANVVYTIAFKAINAFGSSAFFAQTVTVFETPNVTFSGANTFCQGSSTNLSASSTILAASPTIFYTWAPTSGLNTTSGAFVTANPAVTTIYTVTATKGSCSNTGQITVMPLSIPVLNVTSSSMPLCLPGSATLQISTNAASYSVNGVASSSVFVISPTINTQYVVSTSTNVFGCSNTNTFTQAVSSCTDVSIAEYGKNTNVIRAYPNPNNGDFTIKSYSKERITITNGLGQLVSILEPTGGEEQKVSGLQAGIYFVNTSRVTLKIIVTR
jgi:trimeric autotransporter adhesin